MNNQTIKISGLLACAGKSERIGSPKPLLIYRGLPFCVLILAKMNLICERIVVVLGHKADEVRNELEKYVLNTNKLKQELRDSSLIDHISEMSYKIEIVINENYEIGMFSSLQCGIEKLSGSDWALCHFTDQPTLPVSFYLDLIKQLDDQFDWIQPRFNAQNGHPILLNHRLFQKIIFSPRNSDLRKLTSYKSCKKKYWDSPYPQVLDDIDTPKDFFSI